MRRQQRRKEERKQHTQGVYEAGIKIVKLLILRVRLTTLHYYDARDSLSQDVDLGPWTGQDSESLSVGRADRLTEQGGQCCLYCLW
jgi:hypothetical protein